MESSSWVKGCKHRHDNMVREMQSYSFVDEGKETRNVVVEKAGIYSFPEPPEGI
jgi:hypothetical protein